MHVSIVICMQCMYVCIANIFIFQYIASICSEKRNNKLFIIHFWLFQTGDECPSELLVLKMNIQKLNYELEIGDWKLMYLRTHRHFRPEEEPKQGNTTLPTLPSTGGNLLVHDRGVILAFFVSLVYVYNIKLIKSGSYTQIHQSQLAANVMSSIES